jgi:CheY-like chemotaxis protein
VQPAADAKQVRIQTLIDPRTGPVSGDPDRLQQVAWNLLSNAVKFTPPGGRVAVRVYRDGNEARLDVEDNGKGISPEFMPRVFELFQQSDPGITRRHSGMGIGLALVRQLVDLQGGRIEAVSAGENKGSRFTVWLPLYVASSLPKRLPLRPATAPKDDVAASDGADAVAAAQPPHPRRLEGLRVLVVEDDVASADALSALLEEEGAHVRAVNSGSDALAVTSGHTFDVVVSDIAMPNMDGHALLRKLRQDERYAHTPAIACTGFDSQGEIEQAKRSGFAAHLSKPLAVPRLIQAMQAAVAGRNRSDAQG